MNASKTQNISYPIPKLGASKAPGQTRHSGAHVAKLALFGAAVDRRQHVNEMAVYVSKRMIAKYPRYDYPNLDSVEGETPVSL
jgi:hypothetical protein